MILVGIFLHRRIEKMTSEILLVEHVWMEMAKIFQEADRMSGARAGAEGQGHLASQSAMSIAFRAAKRSFDITAAAVGMVRDQNSLRILEMHLAKPAFRAVCA